MFKFGGKNDWQIITIPRLVGEEGETRVTFIDAPFRFSPSRNKTRLVDDDVGSMLPDELFVRQPMYAKRIDVTHLSALCFRCGAVLPDQPAQEARFELTIVYKSFDPFTLVVETPAVRCAACGTANADPSAERQNEALEAMVAAFESLDVER